MLEPNGQINTPPDFQISEHLYAALKAIHADYKESPCKYKSAHLARVVSTLVIRENQWRVVGITDEALTELKNNGFEKPGGRLIQRGHLVPRAAVALYIFKNDELIGKEELEYVLWFYDRTILMTSEQNKTTDQPPNFYLFDQNSGEKIFSSAYIGFKYSKREKKFLEDFSKNLPKEKSDIDTLYPDWSKFKEIENAFKQNP